MSKKRVVWIEKVRRFEKVLDRDFVNIGDVLYRDVLRRLGNTGSNRLQNDDTTEEIVRDVFSVS